MPPDYAKVSGLKSVPFRLLTTLNDPVGVRIKVYSHPFGRFWQYLPFHLTHNIAFLHNFYTSDTI